MISMKAIDGASESENRLALIGLPIDDKLSMKTSIQKFDENFGWKLKQASLSMVRTSNLEPNGAINATVRLFQRCNCNFILKIDY